MQGKTIHLKAGGSVTAAHGELTEDLEVNGTVTKVSRKAVTITVVPATGAPAIAYADPEELEEFYHEVRDLSEWVAGHNAQAEIDASALAEALTEERKDEPVEPSGPASDVVAEREAITAGLMLRKDELYQDGGGATFQLLMADDVRKDGVTPERAGKFFALVEVKSDAPSPPSEPPHEDPDVEPKDIATRVGELGPVNPDITSPDYGKPVEP